MKTRPDIIPHRGNRPRPRARAAALAIVLAAGVTATAGHAQPQGQGKPSITLRATPSIAFAPARIVATAELRNGADDYQDFYCAKVEWTWGDGTTSEQQDDCDPYVAGTSQIRRRYSNEHKFELPGNYDIRFSLLQGKKSVGGAALQVRVRDGIATVISR